MKKMKRIFAFLLIAAILLAFASCSNGSSELPMSLDDFSRMNGSQAEISVPDNADFGDETEGSAVCDISPEDVSEISSEMSAWHDVSYEYSVQPEEPNCEASDAISDVSEKSFEPEENTPASFTRQVFRSADGTELKYWLYTPENAVSGMPLVVCLHGGSGKGNNLELITAVDGFPKYLSDGLISPDAYVIIPQLSADRRGWSDIGTQFIRLIASVVKTYSVDEMKISLTGHSMGGTGAWQLALMYPGTFSCVAPMSGSVTLSQQNIAKLKNIPVWAFVGSADTIVPPESSQRFIAALETSGGNAKITVIDGADHFAVPAVYLDKSIDVIGWLINQSR